MPTEKNNDSETLYKLFSDLGFRTPPENITSAQLPFIREFLATERKLRFDLWIEEARNIVFIGDAGVGKSHVAKSLCYDAIHRGENAYFTSAFDLIGKLKKSLNPETKVSYFGTSIKVLCIDELGYTQQNKDAGDLLFQIIAKRSESLPTIITTNLPPKQWGSIFSGPAATAILDRLNYNGRFITMEGPSYRMTTKKK